jgi:dihydrofolate synthase / folylpolyglutamate synthase
MPDHAHSTSPAVQAQLDRLGTLSPGRDTLGLERVTTLCARLGNPQDRLPPVFHVAGTNGKGSTCAFLRAMLEAAGHRVHVYTSPHLVRFNERIRLAGTLINDDDLATTLARVLDAADGLNASFFEITSAAAFLRFSEEPADACVIEVGLGGRLDATNIIRRPLVTGIASLGIDHREFLLSTDPDVPDMPDMERIAFEKAGIAKAGVPLVTLSYDAPVAARIATSAAQATASLVMQGRHWRSEPIGRGFLIADQQGKLYADPPALPGVHQQANAALAITMLHAQPLLSVPEAAIQRGLAAARWPGRMQRLSNGPLVDLVPTAAVWLDGGHNPDGGAALAANFPNELSIDLVIGMLANKDAVGFLSPLAKSIRSLTALPVPGHAHHDPTELAALARTKGVPKTRASDSVTDALTELASDNSTCVLICGSLYLAGEVLRLNGELPD